MVAFENLSNTFPSLSLSSSSIAKNLERVFPKSDGIGMKRDSARESATVEESVSAFSSPMESEMRVIPFELEKKKVCEEKE